MTGVSTIVNPKGVRNNFITNGGPDSITFVVRYLSNC